MQFFAPENFFLLWLVPAVLGLYWLSHAIWTNRMHQLIREKALFTKMVAGYRPSEWFVRPLVMALVVLLAILALARPQWGDEKKQVQRKGVDLVFLVDTSLSMLAEDIKPNRLEKAKFEIDAFLNELRGDRIGMVTYAGSGFLQTPLTLDHAAFRLFLDAVQVGFLPDPGTSLSQAIRMAIRAFPQKELKYKALIILTEGEDHEGGIDEAIEEAKKAGVRIYTIGLGTAEGEPIPLKNEQGVRQGFKKDRNGQMVITKLDEPLLQKIANDTGGLYLPATPGEKEVSLIAKHLAAWGEQKFSEKMIVEKEDQYQVFVLLAFLLLISEMLIRRRDGKAASLLGCVLAFFFFTGFLGSSDELVDKGNDQFKQKKYQSALENYRKVQVRKPDDPEVLYNLGTALYKTDQFQESSQDLGAAAEKIKEPKLKAKTLYNYGNTQYRLGNFDAAIDAYKKTLEIDPSDKDAKYNLEFLQNQKNKFDQKDKERKKQDDKKEKKDQQKQNQNQQQQQQKKQDQQDQGGQGQQEQQDQQSKPDQQDKKDPQDQQDPDQQQQQKPDEKEQGQQGSQDQQEKDRQKEQEQQQKQAEQEKQEQEQGEKPDQEQQRQGQQKRPLQGQMSMDNALTILDALKDSEKELQDLRRPPVERNQPPVEKDW